MASHSPPYKPLDRITSQRNQVDVPQCLGSQLGLHHFPAKIAGNLQETTGGML